MSIILPFPLPISPITTYIIITVLHQKRYYFHPSQDQEQQFLSNHRPRSQDLKIHATPTSIPTASEVLALVENLPRFPGVKQREFARKTAKFPRKISHNRHPRVLRTKETRLVPWQIVRGLDNLISSATLPVTSDRGGSQCERSRLASLDSRRPKVFGAAGSRRA